MEKLLSYLVRFIMFPVIMMRTEKGCATVLSGGYIAHNIRKTGYYTEMNRKTGIPAPLPIGYGSEVSKKL